MKFQQLTHTIQQVQEQIQLQVSKTINQGLTLRNWLVGYFIVEYEQNGDDRATYGTQLLQKLARSIDAKGFSASDLSRYRQFYQIYPQILGTLPQEFMTILTSSPIFGALPQISSRHKSAVNPDLLNNLSFSHFAELIKIDNDLQREFYEKEAIKGAWSTRELKRQIGSLYYDRSIMSKDKSALSQQTQEKIKPQSRQEALKDYYVFEFLDLADKHTVTEQDLETALLDHIQELILELGEGFCFEARQKRLLIGDEYYFVDLVFYHRILKCHVLIELKVEPFNHGHMGQLNTYLNYYNDQIKTEDDHPAIGLLLVTDQNETLVNYALAGMEESLFVKNYKLKLPDEAAIKAAIQKYLKK